MQENQVSANQSEIAAVTAKQENTHQNVLDQHYPCVLAKLESLSAEQLNLYIHEVKWLLKQFTEIRPGPESPNREIGERSSQIETQVFVIQDALILEQARRQALHLQTLLTSAGTPHESKDAL